MKPRQPPSRSHTLYLRSNVIRCATEGLGCDSIIHILFTHAKVCDFNVALTVQHYIVQLQISVRGWSKVKKEQQTNQLGIDTRNSKTSVLKFNLEAQKLWEMWSSAIETASVWLYNPFWALQMDLHYVQLTAHVKVNACISPNNVLDVKKG